MTASEVLDQIRRASHEHWTELDLAQCDLKALPPEIAEASGLRRLHLNANRLTALPPEICELAKLEELYIEDNELCLLPSAIGNLRSLRHLHVERNALTKVPPSIGGLKFLLELGLARNQLTTIPETIGNLRALRQLDLSFNSLAALPQEIGRLASLEELRLRNNRLAHLPSEIGQLRHLRRLDAAENDLSNIPTAIGKLGSLGSLSLANNKLTNLPQELGTMPKLQNLDLSKNQLTALPLSFANLDALERLSLAHNEFAVLPPEIGGLSRLKTTDYTGNSLSQMPPEILSQGPSAVLSYLRAMYSEGTHQWISKVLLVGQGGVGKTSLLRKLRGESFDFQESSTRGIEVGRIEFKHPELPDVTMQLNTWDFAGQEIYHATHQFFLTNRSLFLLVWNARHGYEQGKIYYWLDTISNLAPQSPIIIVATHIDERDADIPLADLKRRYPNIAGHCEVSNRNGTGLDKLRTLLCSVAAKLPLMGERWPKRWLDAAHDISSSKDKYTSPVRLFDVLTSRGLQQHESGILLQWLHDLGEILFFRGIANLSDIVILKPQWVTSYIGKVLESDQVIEQTTLEGHEVLGRYGILTRSYMEAIWSDLDPTMRDHFLRLMEQFDLSYRTLENDDISIVVERLSQNPVDYHRLWDEMLQRPNTREVAMNFVLNTTIPAGVPTWFIARSHRFTTYNHWRHGAVFQDSNAQRHLALIEAFPHERYLRLVVRGPCPHNFFALMRDGLEVTLARFPGLKLRRMVPCPGHFGEACKHEFALSNLESALERTPPVLEMQCPVSFEQVSVPGLLLGLHWRTQDAILERIERLDASELRRHETLKDEIGELRALTQREFLSSFRREQADVDVQCPNVFTLEPDDDAEIQTLLARSHSAPLKEGWEEFVTRKVVLQLFCQMPGKWHPAEMDGRYEIRQAGTWLRAMAPFLRRLITMLKHVGPVVGPALSVMSPEGGKELKTRLEGMKALVDAIPEPGDEWSLQAEHTEETRVKGSTLRAVRALLDQLDPVRNWGGLQKVLTPEGHILWLCERHAAEFRV